MCFLWWLSFNYLNEWYFVSHITNKALTAAIIYFLTVIFESNERKKRKLLFYNIKPYMEPLNQEMFLNADVLYHDYTRKLSYVDYSGWRGFRIWSDAAYGWQGSGRQRHQWRRLQWRPRHIRSHYGNQQRHHGVITTGTHRQCHYVHVYLPRHSFYKPPPLRTS